ncbi:MAG: hypothetical protein JKX70_05650 [Phycisphaerales bacterium]|nr:hypothetical protein [Phycisphaerales bacterium]
MDPLDQLNVPTPAMPSDGSPDGQSADDAPAGYGHIPFADSSARISQEYSPVMRTQARRDVFWNNVVREILMSLASAAAHSSGRLDTGPAAANASTSPVDDLFDGRMGVITTLGQRIPIADIMPVFSCSMAGCEADRMRSKEVQCTVYRITTPTGEAYTLPISQIIGVHSLSDALMDQLEHDEIEEDEVRVPFGFKAYTSLVQSEEAEQDRDDSEESGSIDE